MRKVIQIVKRRCDESTQFASDALDRKLKWSEWLKMHTHIRLCAGCKQFMRHLRQLSQWSEELLGSDSERVDVEETLADDVRQRIAEAMRRDGNSDSADI